VWREAPAFADRRDAGRRLATALANVEGRDPLVLALPRGGVPVGFEVAQALKAELDVLLVRKIGAPSDPELGLGALVDGDPPELVLNEEMVRAVAPKAAYIERERQRQLIEIERRRRLYGRSGRAAVAGRTVILVDDGIATGGTARAALAALKRRHPGRVILAVPVAAEGSLEPLRPSCDDIVCLLTPSTFRAVGEHYGDFTQTTDEEVVRLLAEARQRGT
jgi:putative phosphoribosyl transferase